MNAVPSTVVYVLSPSGDSLMQNIQMFENMFNRDTRIITDQTVDSAADNGISYIKEAKSLGSAGVNDMQQRRKPYNFDITIEKTLYQGSDLALLNIQANQIGSVFFVLVSNNTGANSLQRPSAEEVLNCRNAQNLTAVNCTRLLFTAPDQVFS